MTTDAQANDLSAAKEPRLQEATPVEIARAKREGTRLVMTLYGKRRYQAKFDAATDEYIAVLEAALTASEARCERLAGAVEQLRDIEATLEGERSMFGLSASERLILTRIRGWRRALNAPDDPRKQEPSP